LAQVESLRLYCSPDGKAFRESIANYHELDPTQVILANGSDDILNVLTRTFVSSGNARLGTLVPQYSLYPVLTSLQGGELEKIEFSGDFKLPVDAIRKSEVPIFFITSPNAPTGVGFSNDDFRKILDDFTGLLVIDEAYADFAQENAVELLSEYPNVFITRTFSKSYSLAGLRVGYGLGNAELIKILHGVRDVYNLDRLAQAGGQAALEDRAWFEQCRNKVLSTRENFTGRLDARGWFTYPSQSNFLFTEPKDARGNANPEVARSLFEFLKSRKILLRYFPKHTLTDRFLRITIGTDFEMETLHKGIDQWLTNE
jgi:histidinol-phosphate aminotransferase